MADELDDELDDIDVDGAVAELDDQQTPAPDAGVSAIQEDERPGDYAAEADDVVAEDDGAVGEQPRGPDGKFLSKPEAAAAEPTDPAAAAAAAAAELPDPFAAYSPFQFRVDGTDVNLDGIRANDTHVVIPRELWQRELMPNYLGSREAWQEQRGQWTQREREYQQAIQQEQLERKAVVDEFNALISDPQRLQQFLTDFERELPVLQQKLRADAAERQLHAQQYRLQQQQQQAEYSHAFEAGTTAFEAECVSLLKDPAFSALAASPEERDDLLAEIWTLGGPQHVLIDARGQVSIDKDWLQQQFARRASVLARREAQWRKVSTTEQRNAAAVAPPATSPRTAPIPKANGSKPATPNRRPAPRQAPVTAPPRITDEMREQFKNDYASILDGE